MASDQDNEALLAQAMAKFYRIDILVNCAGIGKMEKITSPTFMKSFDKIMSINVRGMLNLIYQALPYIKQTKGNIVNMSSIASQITFNDNLAYSISKAAVTKMTKSLANELGEMGIRVNEVAPGCTETPILDMLEKDLRDAWVKALSKKAVRGLNQPEEVARAIVFLASDIQSPTTSGLTFVIDGGFSCSPPGM